MQEHAVPQNITSFEFKLIGDMTLRQFGYVGTGIALALLFFFAKPLPIWVRFPFIFLCPAIGFALAFMPVEGRSLDRWLVSFIHAVFGNTLYIWKKEGVQLEALHNISSSVAIASHDQDKQLLANMPTTAKKYRVPKNALDAEEIRILGGIQPVMSDGSPSMIRSTSNTPRAMQNGVHNNQAPQPHVPYTKTFAGPAVPVRTIPGQMMRTNGAPAIPTAMRMPHQKPLAPKRIPLPSYQMAPSQSQVSQPTMSSTPQTPVLQNVISNVRPTTNSMTPSLITHHPLATAVQAPSYTPSQTGQYQSVHPSPLPYGSGTLQSTSTLQLGQNVPAPNSVGTMQSQGAPQASSSAEMTRLRQQNEFLFNKLQALEQTLQTSLSGRGPMEDTASQERLDLTGQITTLENTLNQVVTHVDTLTNQEQQYSTLLSDIKQQLDTVSQEKNHAEDELRQLKDSSTATQEALEKSEATRKELEATLQELQNQLQTTNALSQDLKERKQKVEAGLSSYAAKLDALSATPPSFTQSYGGTSATSPMLRGAGQIPQPPLVEKPSLPLKPIKKAKHSNAKPVSDIKIPEHLSIQTKSLPTITTTPNAISGYAFDEEAKPIMDVIVVVKKENGPTMRALKSNRVGQFSIVSPLPEGKYEVSFEKDDFSFEEMALEAKGEVIAPLKVLGKRVS